MKYLVMSFDAQGRRLATESAATEAGLAEVVAYARTLRAVQVYVYKHHETVVLEGNPNE